MPLCHIKYTGVFVNPLLLSYSHPPPFMQRTYYLYLLKYITVQSTNVNRKSKVFPNHSTIGILYKSYSTHMVEQRERMVT